MSLLTSLRRIVGVALFVSWGMMKDWSSHVLRLLLSAWVAVPFYAFGGGRAALHALVGAAVSAVFTTCIFSAYEEAIYDIYFKLRDFFLASPLTGFEFRAGIALGLFLTDIPSLVVILAPLFAFSGSPAGNIVLSLVVLLALWAASVLMGYLIPILRNPLATGNVVRIITLVFTALPPVYYPLEAWPEPLRPLAYPFPTFCAAELIRLLLGLQPYEAGRLLLAAAALAAETAVIGVLVARQIKG